MPRLCGELEIELNYHIIGASCVVATHLLLTVQADCQEMYGMTGISRG